MTPLSPAQRAALEWLPRDDGATAECEAHMLALFELRALGLVCSQNYRTKINSVRPGDGPPFINQPCASFWRITPAGAQALMEARDE